MPSAAISKKFYLEAAVPTTRRRRRLDMTIPLLLLAHDTGRESIFLFVEQRGWHLIEALEHASGENFTRVWDVDGGSFTYIEDHHLGQRYLRMMGLPGELVADITGRFAHWTVDDVLADWPAATDDPSRIELLNRLFLLCSVEPDERAVPLFEESAHPARHPALRLCAVNAGNLPMLQSAFATFRGDPLIGRFIRG
jgi:hypothetical protein